VKWINGSSMQVGEEWDDGPAFEAWMGQSIGFPGEVKVKGVEAGRSSSIFVTWEAWFGSRSRWPSTRAVCKQDAE
jgi:hypothetical protein